MFFTDAADRVATKTSTTETPAEPIWCTRQHADAELAGGFVVHQRAISNVAGIEIDLENLPGTDQAAVVLSSDLGVIELTGNQAQALSEALQVGVRLLTIGAAE